MRPAIFTDKTFGLRISFPTNGFYLVEHESGGCVLVEIGGGEDNSFNLKETFNEAVAEQTAAMRDCEYVLTDGNIIQNNVGPI